MTAAPHATRMTTNAIAGELDLLAREARDIAETAARFARDVDTALTCGDAGRIAQEAQSLLLRATRVRVSHAGPGGTQPKTERRTPVDEKRHAELRMLDIGALHPDRANDPVGWADAQTSMADARIASCVADGIPIEDIDPCGYDLSRRAYEISRRSWRTNWHTCHGTASYRRDMQDAYTWWAEQRPHYTDGDDWFAGLTKPEETY